MKGKVPDDAFQQYVAMGPDRSYAAIARRFGVSKRAVQKLASREEWAERVARIEEAARETSDRKAAETIAEMRERHLRTLRAMNGRVLMALKDLHLESAMDAMRAAKITIQLERLIAGESTERSEVVVERVTKRELESLLAVEGEDGDDEDAEEHDAGAAPPEG